MAEHVVQQYETIRNQDEFRRVVRQMEDFAQKNPFDHKAATEEAVKHGDIEIRGDMVRVRGSKRIPMMDKYNRFLTILPINEEDGAIHAFQFTYTYTSVPENMVERFGQWVGQLTVIDNQRVPIPESLSDYLACFLDEVGVEDAWWPQANTPPHVLIMFHKL